MEGYVIIKRKKNEEVLHVLIQKNSLTYRNATVHNWVCNVLSQTVYFLINT